MSCVPFPAVRARGGPRAAVVLSGRAVRGEPVHPRHAEIQEVGGGAAWWQSRIASEQLFGGLGPIFRTPSGHFALVRTVPDGFGQF